MWLDPMPTPEDIHEAYQSYFTHDAAPPPTALKRLYHRVRLGYLARRFGYGNGSVASWQRTLGAVAGPVPHLRARFDFNAMWLSAKPGGRLLEVGSGRGDALKFFMELGWQAQGVDFDPAAVAIARSRTLDVRHGSLHAQAYPAESFDAVVMSHVIEHLHDPLGTTKECRRILRQGGKMVALTPNTGSLGHRLFGRHWLHLDPPRHLHLFNSHNLSKLFVEAGFKRVSCFAVIRDAEWTLGASWQIKRRGFYRMGALPFWLWLSGFVMMYAEWLAMIFAPQLGEEIVVIAEK
ncbi:MAG: class I SAM-dependent methyltransferase [Dongiaceae bacterium]